MHATSSSSSDLCSIACPQFPSSFQPITTFTHRDAPPPPNFIAPKQSELDREETRKQDDASAWIVKARQLEAEADWASDTANALAAKNAAIQEANARLKRQHEAGEADRSYLLEQLVTVKKDSAALTMHASKVC
jgi:hypothetical protein